MHSALIRSQNTASAQLALSVGNWALCSCLTWRQHTRLLGLFSVTLEFALSCCWDTGPAWQPLQSSLGSQRTDHVHQCKSLWGFCGWADNWLVMIDHFGGTPIHSGSGGKKQNAIVRWHKLLWELSEPPGFTWELNQELPALGKTGRLAQQDSLKSPHCYFSEFWEHQTARQFL